jgi:hypothetical protein
MKKLSKSEFLGVGAGITLMLSGGGVGLKGYEQFHPYKKARDCEQQAQWVGKTCLLQSLTKKQEHLESSGEITTMAGVLIASTGLMLVAAAGLAKSREEITVDAPVESPAIATIAATPQHPEPQVVVQPVPEAA